MRRIWLGLRWFSLLVLVALVVLALWVFVRIRRALPETAGAARAAGLAAEVRISRDAYGVPSITAASERDLIFAQG
jgi:penicillin amidase